MQRLWAGKKILVVDDSELVRKQLGEFYQHMGLVISGFAQDGLGALRACEELLPDVVSMDIIMPEIHGLDCYRKIKGRAPGIKIFFVSCLVGSHAFGEESPEGIPREYFVSKPPDEASVSRALELLFGSYDSDKSRVSPPGDKGDRLAGGGFEELPSLPDPPGCG